MANNYIMVANKLKADGYKFEMGKYISDGWKKGTEVIGWFILMAIVTSVISSVAGVIPIVGPLANNFVISPVLGAGMILFFHHKYVKGESDFGLLFKGFSQNFGQIVLLNLLLVLITIGVMLPFIISFIIAFDFSLLISIIETQNPNAALEIANMLMESIGTMAVGMIISTIGTLVITVLFALSNYFVVVGNTSAVESLGASYGVVKRNFFPILWFFIVLGLINVLGVLCLIVGVIVTMPVTLMAIYAMFNHLIVSKVGDDETLIHGDDILDA